MPSLGWEDPLEEGMATHSSILAWRIPWTEEPGGLQSISHKESDTTGATEHAHRQRMFLGQQTKPKASFITTEIAMINNLLICNMFIRTKPQR